LILGPFHGKVACQTIRFGTGVCGKAAQSGQTQLVPDVEVFPGHIACDSESQSEIVVPIIQNGRVRSVLLLSWKALLIHSDSRLLLSSTLTVHRKMVSMRRIKAR